MSRRTRRACLVPLPGGMNRSTSSLTARRPTRSLLATALKAIRAATSAATARLVCLCVPNRWLPLTSTARRTVSSRSSTNRLMNGAPMRAVTFQSIDRTSSPGWYSRTSSKERPVPLKTEWYSPPSRVWTARRARSCRRRICRITSAGSMGLLLAGVLGLWPGVDLHPQLRGGNLAREVPRHPRVGQCKGTRRRQDDLHSNEPIPAGTKCLAIIWSQESGACFTAAEDEGPTWEPFTRLEVVNLDVKAQVHVELLTDAPPGNVQPQPQLPVTNKPAALRKPGVRLDDSGCNR